MQVIEITLALCKWILLQMKLYIRWVIQKNTFLRAFKRSKRIGKCIKGALQTDK